jgi:hypothetical protein
LHRWGHAKRFKGISENPNPLDGKRITKGFEKVGYVKGAKFFTLIITTYQQSIHHFAVIPGLTRDLLHMSKFFLTICYFQLSTCLPSRMLAHLSY